ncbi:dsDNA nuclease domain-containing protein [Nitrosospira sp. Nsp14]|uniref:dsDNA nuclease domain-containing protein n=1 Tax=Nitrosospira sp. Nsp14 TaxID=1855333 RepID=UPI0015A638DA|nr:dsDNA nuclease domain-containing protein [Nitrosospira sp. Nsp14]
MTRPFKNKKKQEQTLSPNSSNDLLSLLTDKPTDEKAGVNATLGFSYQHWWATLKATELYAQGNDFAIGMEIKEDVAVLDSPTVPTTVQFYQVKKHEREGVWSWSNLLRSTSKTGTCELSPLAKLYSRRHTFKSHPTKLCFISNLAFKVPLEEGTSLQHSDGCGLHEFIASKSEEVKQKLASQLGISSDKVDLTDFTLERTNLPLGEQDTFITGKLSTLSDTGKLPFEISRPHISARMLAAEFQQKGTNTDYANTFHKLRARCLSRDEITQVLQSIESAGPPVQVALEEALTRLDHEQYHYGKRDQIRREKIALCAHLSDRTNIQVARLYRLFVYTRNKVQTELEEIAKLGEIMEYLVAEATEEQPLEVAGLPKGYLNGLALLVIKNAINVHLFSSAAHPKPEEQE